MKAILVLFCLNVSTIENCLLPNLRHMTLYFKGAELKLMTIYLMKRGMSLFICKVISTNSSFSALFQSVPSRKRMFAYLTS